MQVLVLAGGLSAERDVSLRSGRRVAEALRTARPDWQVIERDVDADVGLPFDNLPDGLGQPRSKCRFVDRHACCLGAHCLQHIRGPGQAAGVGGEDTIRRRGHSRAPASKGGPR